jgi:hypothetical protein
MSRRLSGIKAGFWKVKDAASNVAEAGFGFTANGILSSPDGWAVWSWDPGQVPLAAPDSEK